MTKACVPAWPLGDTRVFSDVIAAFAKILREWNGANRQFPTYLADEIVRS
jgi:hypothetical protein